MKEFLGSKGVTAAELERTVNGSTQELPGSFETSGDVLTEMQRDVLYERPFDYVEGLADKYRALTAKDLDSAARAAIEDRKSVVQGKSVSVRVDLGGRRLIKKKNHTDLHYCIEKS